MDGERHRMGDGQVSFTLEGDLSGFDAEGYVSHRVNGQARARVTIRDVGR